jgi:predicted nucleotide-binding protein
VNLPRSTLFKQVSLVARAFAEGVGRDGRTVLVVHGRNERARGAVFAFLEALDLRPMGWAAARVLTGKPSPYAGEILEAAFQHACAVFVLLTGDEEVRLRDALRSGQDAAESPLLQARPNVLFEAGMAMGRAPERTVLAQLGPVRPFSDLFGRHVVVLNNTVTARHELAEQLRLAKLDVNTSGLAWHTAGDFDGAVV